MAIFFLTVTILFLLIMLSITLYHFFIGIIGARAIKKDIGKEKIEHKPKNSFALIVSAHNEEVVIGNLVDSFNQIDYPKALYDVYVIADNCTDSTAKVARRHGANVYERFNKDKRGKGYALEWMFDKLFKMKKKYDAIAIFDADNLVHKDFLTKINNKMCEGYEVVQCFIDTKNAKDSWVTESCEASLANTARRLQYGRDRLGLSAQLGGTGFALSTEILKKLGWGATCLTEDLEFSCKLVLNNKKIGVADDALIYDEKPLEFNDSWKQRKRWMQGFADVASRYAIPLFKKAIKERSMIAFDCAMYVIQPFITAIFGLTLPFVIFIFMIINASREFINNYIFFDGLWAFICIAEVAFVGFMLIKDKTNIKRGTGALILFLIIAFLQPFFVVDLSILDQTALLTVFNLIYGAIYFGLAVQILGAETKAEVIRALGSMVYVVSWIPITIIGIANKDNKEWSHTKHVRQLGIYEM